MSFDIHHAGPISRQRPTARAALFLAASSVTFGFSVSAPAATTRTWNTASGNWNVPGNWTPTGVPSTGDTADIVHADTTNRNVAYNNVAGASTPLAAVNISNTGGGLDTLTMSTASLTLTSTTQSIGGFSTSTGSGLGQLIQSAGVNNGLTTLSLGYNSVDCGFYTLSGAGSLVVSGANGVEYIGNAGTGAFVQTGGTNTLSGTNASLYLGNSAASTGTYAQSGSSILSVPNGYEFVGFSGNGAFTQTAGSNTMFDDLFLGDNPSGSGRYSLSGSGALTVEVDLFVAQEGTGSFTQSGGTNSVGDSLIVGGSGGSGVYTLTAGTLTAGPFGDVIGDFGHGVFIQSGGANTINSGPLEVGYGSVGSYTLSGSGTLTVNGGQSEYIGYGSTLVTKGTTFGTFDQTGGSNTMVGFGSAFYVGYNAGATGTYILSNGTLSGASSEFVGYSGVGNFNQSGGANSTSTVSLGLESGGIGAYTLSGAGTLTVSTLYIGGALTGPGTGSFIQTGGTNNVGTISMSLDVGGVASYSLSGTGTLNASDEEIGINGLANFSQSGGSNIITSGIQIGDNAGSTGTYTLTGTGTLSTPLVNIGGSGTTGGEGVFTAGGGTLTVAGAITVNNSTATTLTLSSGSITAATLVLPGGVFTQSGGSATLAQITGTGSASITGGKTTLTSHGGASTVAALTVNSTGTLDITNNKVVINYAASAADPVTSITAALTSGYNAGSWTGPGIQSSAAAANPGKFAIGYLDGNRPADAAGSHVAANQLIFKFTLAGDAFLENSVGFDDLVAVAQDFGKTGQDWAGGNFNYDPTGSVGFADLVSVAQNFGASSGISEGSSAPALSPAWQSAPISVPEPAALPLTLAASLLSRRRPRKTP